MCLNIIRVGSNYDSILGAYKAKKKCYKIAKDFEKRFVLQKRIHYLLRVDSQLNKDTTIDLSVIYLSVTHKALRIFSNHLLKYRYFQKVRAVTPIGYSPNGMI